MSVRVAVKCLVMTWCVHGAPVHTDAGPCSETQQDTGIDAATVFG
jgi:hypothetical protein